MSTFANPLNPAQKAKEAADNAFAVVDISSGGAILATVIGRGKPVCFRLQGARDASDSPSNANAGMGAEGWFVPANDVNSGMVYYSQARENNAGLQGRLWYRPVRDSTWATNWRMLTGTTVE